MLHTVWIRGLNNPFPECRGRWSSVSPLCRNSRLLARFRSRGCVVSRTGSPLSRSTGHTDSLLHTLRLGRMATFSRKLKLSQLAPWERAKLFQGPLSGGGKKTIQNPYTGTSLTIQGPLMDFYTGLQQGKGGGGKQMQKGEERNALNLLLDVNKKIVHVWVDGGRPGEAEKIIESPIDYLVHFYLDSFPTWAFPQVDS